MAALRKWRALAPTERWLLLQALVLVAVFRAALLLVSFQRLRRLAERRAGNAAPPPEALARTGWAIAVAADLVRGSTCLPQALAAQALEGGALRVGQIAQSVGYSSDKVFARAFARWSGLAPGAYARGRRPPREGDAREPGDRLA